jgi:DNA-binding transcriptional ArsR family regulator
MALKRLSDEALDLVAARFRVLGEPVRLKLLQLVCEREMSVTELVERSGAGQANVSKHLGILLEAGLVARRKEGLNVFYSMADESVMELCDIVCRSLGVRLAAQHNYFKHLKRKP